MPYVASSAWFKTVAARQTAVCRLEQGVMILAAAKVFRVNGWLTRQSCLRTTSLSLFVEAAKCFERKSLDTTDQTSREA